MKFIYGFLWFCCCVSQTWSENGFQSWVIDPRYSLYPSLPNVAPQSQDDTCKRHSQVFLSELKNKTLWAVQMWDSSAKAPVGIISGSIYHFGNFDECLKTAAPFPVQYCIAHVVANISSEFWSFAPSEKVPPDANAWSYIAIKTIRVNCTMYNTYDDNIVRYSPKIHYGQSPKLDTREVAKARKNHHGYVLMTQKSRLDVSKVPRDVLAWGLCAPASCNSSDLQLTINSHIMSITSNMSDQTTYGAMIYPEFCTKATDRIKFTPGEIAFWVFFFTLVLLTATSTLMDLVSNSERTKNSKIYDIWMFFSIKQNFTHVVPLKKTSKSPLDVFHGIKFVSILFILYGHRVGVSISLSTMNYDEIEDYLIQDHKMFFVHTDLVVDTFFFISGLLASQIMMEVFSKRFINPIYSILVRVSRLAPLYFFIIWFQSTAAFRMGSGPLWQAIAKNETEYCVDHWWSNVFFFSNYYKTDEMCMPHSWFLPCELHFFVVTAVLIPIIVKFPLCGRIILGVLTVISAIIPAVVIYINKIQPLILFYYEFLVQPRKYDSFNILYVKSHNRATVYLIGLAVGLFLYHTKNSKTRISKKLTFCGVLAWFAFLFAPMAYGSLYYDLNKSYNALEAAIFGSLRRVSWGIGFSIFILAHRFGTIPLVDFFFSSRLAVFFSRITYGVYLIHFNIITTEILKTRSAMVFTIPNVVVEGIGDALKSIVATVFLVFILEVPLKRILRELLFQKRVKELEEPKENQNVCTVRL